MPSSDSPPSKEPDPEISLPSAAAHALTLWHTPACLEILPTSTTSGAILTPWVSYFGISTPPSASSSSDESRFGKIVGVRCCTHLHLPPAPFASEIHT
ncbi:hypothetical protein NL676_011977 [Syzygium grande]|nr:hypothetical protein NL676_011977 [Syzygium grande]